MNLDDKKKLRKLFRKGMSKKGMTIEDVAITTGINEDVVRRAVRAESNDVSIDEFCTVAILLFRDETDLLQGFEGINTLI
ncbi:hypothetical protein ACQW5G_07030 [Fructilactobacillus sp. Tb1]|uniref:hypothetical protein n=1 Tax=Fructilactobacillus sp. Tb1 TaxID=3422304 RepID=UPI003D2C4C1B